MSSTHPLHHLRTATLRRWVLACVLMAWGAAWAAPLLQPAGLHLVCSASGHVKLITTAPSDAGEPGHAGDCPLCTPPSLITATASAWPGTAAVAGGPVVAGHPSPPSATTGALPPARGPPLH